MMMLAAMSERENSEWVRMDVTAAIAKVIKRKHKEMVVKLELFAKVGEMK